MTDHLPPNWQHRLCEVLGAHAGPENVRLLNAWAVAEGGSARWNPLNTTYPLPGSTDFNSAHVKNYRRPTDGVCATALTLVNGFYPGILGELQDGTLTAEAIVATHASQFRRWGTNPETILAVLAHT